MDEDWHLRREHVLKICLEHLEEVRTKGLKIWGPALGVSDIILEDVLLLLEAKESLTEEQWKEFLHQLRGSDMATQKEQELYFAARDRALERHVEANGLISESVAGFNTGLRWAISGPAHEDQEPVWVKEKIKSEDNFAFGFVCGVLARLEAIKGKGYQASWQKRGEADGAMNMVDRKYDRLEATTRHGAAGETKSQVLGDLSVYGIKWLTYRAELDPVEFIKWVEEVRNL